MTVRIQVLVIAHYDYEQSSGSYIKESVPYTYNLEVDSNVFDLAADVIGLRNVLEQLYPSTPECTYEFVKWRIAHKAEVEIDSEAFAKMTATMLKDFDHERYQWMEYQEW